MVGRMALDHVIYVRIVAPEPSFAKASEWHAMFYTYILLSPKSHIFYYGFTEDLRDRLDLHNRGKIPSTKPYLPWKLVWYGAFEIKKLAKDFEEYLKSGAGKAFAYKRLVSEALAKDITEGR